MNELFYKCAKVSKLLFTAAICVMIMTSCYPRAMPSSVYPSSWPALQSVKPNACPSIAGAYMDIGESNYKQLMYSLSKMIFNSQQEGTAAPRVDIRQLTDTVMEISVWSNDELIHHKVYSKEKNEFECTENNGIKLSLGFGSGTYGYAWVFGKKYVNLSKSIDDSLIVRTSIFGYIYVPAEQEESLENMWYRFPAVKKE